MFKKLLLIILLSINNPILADTNNQNVEKELKPYLAIKPVKQDENKIFFFFSYTCPFCQQTHKGFEAWSKTIPEPMRYIEVPIITDEASQMAVLMFYVVKELKPERLPDYNQLAYAVASTSNNAQDYIKILDKIGISPQAANEAIKNGNVQARIKRSYELRSRYKISLTPSIAIDGKYITHAGMTNGDYQLLIRLINAIISQELLQK